MRLTTSRRLTAAALLAGSVVLASAVPALAHVTVQPGTAAQGAYTAIAFHIPDERDTASTTKLEVTLPTTTHPVASVATQPLPGWTATVEKTKLYTLLKTDDGDETTEAVSKITWTADATAKIAPGQFQEFKISLGPLPTDTDKLVFKVLQTYDDGTVVRWIEDSKAGQPEPQHPAPTLTLTKAAASDAAVVTAAPAATMATHAMTAATASSDSTTRTLAIVGIVVGVLGVAVGAYGLRRRSGTGS
ncbi:YcnI family protein [Kitasatospora sp. NBC_00240]|uniref:YcnI family copper-binding membrane protein n=1 Tax=Kitasatospora sp. NBC_00240 TaxID=2903567 RepID=UPI0022580D97|nr:YcnI family protein [Kitasatospora sp. NBC_00240]MCX5215882.1 YcnI family protein [Kitasatospora sp. NBC_00240]